MNTIAQTAVRVLRQLKHQPRTIALIVIAPMLLFYIFSFVLTAGDDGKISIGMLNKNQFFEQICNKHKEQIICLDLSYIKKNEELEKISTNQKIDLALRMESGGVEMFLIETSKPKNEIAKMIVGNLLTEAKLNIALMTLSSLKKAGANLSNLVGNNNLPSSVSSNAQSQQISEQLSTAAKFNSLVSNDENNNIAIETKKPNNKITTDRDRSDNDMIVNKLQSKISTNDDTTAPQKLKINYLYPVDNFSSFDTMAPKLLAVMVFFSVFISSSMMFLKERTSGTLGRIMLSPLRPWQLIFGYILAFGVVVIIQAGVIQIFYYYVLQLNSNGNILEVAAINLSTSLVALTIGMLASIIAKTEFEVVQTIPFLILPQLVLCGIFDISNSPILQKISTFLPVTYACNALTDLMLKNKTDHYIRDVNILLLFSSFFAIMAIIILSKYKPHKKTNSSTMQ